MTVYDDLNNYVNNMKNKGLLLRSIPSVNLQPIDPTKRKREIKRQKLAKSKIFQLFENKENDPQNELLLNIKKGNLYLN